MSKRVGVSLRKLQLYISQNAIMQSVQQQLTSIDLKRLALIAFGFDFVAYADYDQDCFHRATCKACSCIRIIITLPPTCIFFSLLLLLLLALLDMSDGSCSSLDQAPFATSNGQVVSKLVCFMYMQRSNII